MLNRLENWDLLNDKTQIVYTFCVLYRICIGGNSHLKQLSRFRKLAASCNGLVLTVYYHHRGILGQENRELNQQFPVFFICHALKSTSGVGLHTPEL